MYVKYVSFLVYLFSSPQILYLWNLILLLYHLYMGSGFRFHLVSSPTKHHRFAWVHIKFRLKHIKAVDTEKEEICPYKASSDVPGSSDLLSTLLHLLEHLEYYMAGSFLSLPVFPLPTPWHNWHNSLCQLLPFPLNPITLLPTTPWKLSSSDPKDFLIPKTSKHFLVFILLEPMT